MAFALRLALPYQPPAWARAACTRANDKVNECDVDSNAKGDSANYKTTSRITLSGFEISSSMYTYTQEPW